MATQFEQERCHGCDHQRRYHVPRCSHIDCGCSGFTSGLRLNRETVRRKVDKIFQKVILELRDACSSDDEIRKEMHDAVDRCWAEEK